MLVASAPRAARAVVPFSPKARAPLFVVDAPLPHPELLAAIPRLRRYARVLAGDAARADDLVHETLARAWEKRRLWQPGTDLRAWLFTILYRAFLQTRRHQTRFPDVQTSRDNATPTRLPNETTAEPTEKPQSQLVSAAIY